MNIISTTPTEAPVKSIFRDVPENIICFSHLRWDFVFQRPQHLLTRLSKTFNVFYMEEPVFDGGASRLEFKNVSPRLVTLVPHLPPGQRAEQARVSLKELLGEFLAKMEIKDYAFWYYTPMAVEFTRKFNPRVTIFDCMDELSAFKFAPEELKLLEKELLQKADIVFTGGFSLYEAKKNQHDNIYAFPSSIEKAHFVTARVSKKINTRLKLGFYGVIDERFDIDLIRRIAQLRPGWDIELIGPVVKINPETLPKEPNIHYTGPRTYQELPQYMAGWDVALIPFLLNESTRFISPTKTPEYLAAGLPVVSTPIRDVVDPYAKLKLVGIATNAAGFVKACETARDQPDPKAWLRRVDEFLAENSWDLTCEKMLKLMQETMNRNRFTSIAQ